MSKKIFIICGYLASGKSTFALKLSKSLNVPYLMKDTFKIALCESFTDKIKVRRQFSDVTFDAMMYVTERLFETGYPIIIEGNFVPAGVKKVDESAVIKVLIDKYDYQPLTFKFTADTQILYKRFIEREKLPGRGIVNMMDSEPSYDDFCKWCHALDGFSVGGEVIEIDTTDFEKIDFASILLKL